MLGDPSILLLVDPAHSSDDERIYTGVSFRTEQPFDKVLTLGQLRKPNSTYRAYLTYELYTLSVSAGPLTKDCRQILFTEWIIDVAIRAHQLIKRAAIIWVQRQPFA